MSSQGYSELQFYTNVCKIVDLQPEKYPKDYAKDLKEVDKLGITLPKLNIPKDFEFILSGAATANEKENDTTTGSSGEIKATLKSIKPPYKFQKELTTSLSNTVYKLKEDLINSDPDFKQQQFEPANFKFLIKGKVLSDSAFIKEFTSGEDISITVFASAPEPKPEATIGDDGEPDISLPSVVAESSKSTEPAQLTEKIWSGFKEVLLANSISDDESEKILKKLRTNWSA